jgi:hypothetical protein
MGSFAACLVLVLKGPTQPLVAYAAVRQSIAAITQWLLLPSLVIVLLSGLLAIATTSAFHNAAWAWVKALLGLSIFEGTLVTVNASARRAAELAAMAASGQGDSAQLAQALRTGMGRTVATPRAVADQRRAGSLAAAVISSQSGLAAARVTCLLSGSEARSVSRLTSK